MRAFLAVALVATFAAAQSLSNLTGGPPVLTSSGIARGYTPIPTTVNGIAHVTIRLATKETYIQEMAALAETYHAQRCNDLNTCGQPGTERPCSQPACGSYFTSDFSCNGNKSHGTNSECSNCGSAMIRSFDRSDVRFVDGTVYSDPDTRAFVCGSTRMDTVFKANFQQQKLTLWQSIAHTTGAVRTFPGSPQARSASCNRSDVRQTAPWVAATTAAKNIFFLVAIQDASKQASARAAITKYMKALTANDQIKVIEIRGTGTAAVVARGPADADLVDSVISAFNVMNATTGPVLLEPILAKEVYQELDHSYQLRQCSRVMVHLFTDGATLGDDTAVTTLLSNSSRVSLAQLFLTKFGVNHTSAFATKTCQSGGAANYVAATADPTSALFAPFHYYSQLYRVDTVQWTNPWTSSLMEAELDQDKPQIVTGAKAIYSSGTLIGIVSADVGMRELITSAGGFYNEIFVRSEIIRRGNVCPTVSGVTSCKVVVALANAGFETCPSPSPALSTCTNTPASPVCTSTGDLNWALCEAITETTGVSANGPKTTSEVTCCVTCAAGAVSTALIGLLLLFFVLL